VVTKADTRRIVESGANVVLAEQEDEVKRIALCLMEEPSRNVVEISEVTGLEPKVIRYHMKKNEYMRAVHLVATREMKNLIPLAVRGMRDSLSSKDVDVKLRSSLEVLKSENVLGPTRMEVIGGGITDLTVKQLQDIVQRVRGDMPEQTIIDAELA
jgi:predicted transcriptional regulator